MPVLFTSPFPFEQHGVPTPPSIFRRIADAAEALLLVLDGLQFLTILLRETEENP